MSDNDRMRQMRMTPLEAREQNGLRGFGFTVSWEDEKIQSGSGAIGEVKGQARLPDAVGVEPPLPFTLKPRGPLRPHCRRPELCGGYGRVHCYTCLKAAGATTAESDA